MALEENNERGDYRGWLASELASRAGRNRRYSLRAFARDLGVAPSTLSEVLGGRAGLSRETAAKVAARLDLAPPDREYFCALVDAEASRTPVQRRAAAVALARHERRKRFKRVELDRFEAIADWHHAAILELLTIPGVGHTPAAVADRLGIGLQTATEAIARLKRLGLVERKDGRLVPRLESWAVGDDVDDAAIRRFQDQILALGRRALARQPAARREVTSLVVAVDPARLDEAKAMIRDFQVAFTERFAAPTAQSEVFVLGTQLFSVTPHGDAPDAD